MLPTVFTQLLSLATATCAALRVSHFGHTARRSEIDQTSNLSATPTTPFAVTGVLTNSISPRLEIRQLAANTDQFNVFLLAMQTLQQKNETFFLSYYQLSAIHGAPAVAWNNVQGISAAERGQFYPGYCPHQSSIFLPWHRPYVVLFEQVLVSTAQRIAASFPSGPQRDLYTEMASTLRLPYWDWAMDVESGQNALPDFISNPTIEVTMPNGTQTIANPMYSYQFRTIAAQQGLTWFPYTAWSETLRWPTTPYANATMDSVSLNNDLNSIQQDNKQRIYAMFTGNSNFTEVGTFPYVRTSANSYDSFEAVHDQVHLSVGGPNYGEMAVIALSSYDPVFWLHHSMMDRVFALWQALYPDSYVEPARQWTPTFWYENGTVLDATSSLKPFYADPNGQFWTSNSVRNIANFGYTYPELEFGNVSAVKTAINALYGTKSVSISRKIKRTTNSSDLNRLYRLIFKAPKGRLPSSYKLYFFLGDPTTNNNTDWYNDPNLLGSQGFLQGPVQDQGPSPVTVTGVAPLNDKLNQWVDEGRLESLSLNDVLNLFTGNITFRVMMMSKTEASLDLLPELKVGFSSIKFIPAESIDQFPTYSGDWEIHFNVTKGQKGGMNGPEDV